MIALERLAIVVVALAIAIGVIVLLSGAPLTGSDTPGVSGPANEVGTQFKDLGDAHLPAGAPHPAYDSDPPTSGAHVPVAVARDGAVLSVDQLLQALSLGDVVVMYSSRQPPKGLTALADSITAPFSPALAASGQAVILARRPGTVGLLGLAWTRLVHVRSVTDPQLRSFILFWLGRGAARSVP